MVAVTIERTIDCTPEAFLAFALDVERYAEVDDKIGPIRWVRRQSTLTEFKYQPRLPGMSMPEPNAVSRMRLVGNRIEVALAPLPRNPFSRLVSRYRAEFECVPNGAGTVVRRSVSFDFTPPVRRLFEPTLRRTLPASVERELELAKQILERS